MSPTNGNPSDSDPDLDALLRSKAVIGYLAVICASIGLIPILNGLTNAPMRLLGHFMNLLATGEVQPSQIAQDVTYAALTVFRSFVAGILLGSPSLVFLLLYLHWNKKLMAYEEKIQSEQAAPSNR